MKYFHLLTTVVAGLTLAACHTDSKSGAATTKSTPPADASPTTSAVINSLGNFYRQYRGLLPGSTDSITLNLVSVRHSQAEDINESWATYCDANGRPYQLLGRASTTPDSLLLEEITLGFGDANQPGPQWRLRYQGASLVGTRAGQPVQLREAQPAGSVPLAVHYFADSVVAFPGERHSPVGHIGLQVLLPTAANSALTDNLLRAYRGDTLPNQPVAKLPQLWEKQLADFRQMYLEDTKSQRPDRTEAVADTAAPFGYALNYVQQQAAYVYWNQAPLLSIGIYSYSYTGGAHGNYGTHVVTYDTRTGQPLTFDDIFRPSTDAQLSRLLEQKVRQELHIKASEPLDETLLVKKIPVTHNIYLTSGGVVFVYTPYEIGPYALGEIPIFVSLTELQPLLQPRKLPV